MRATTTVLAIESGNVLAPHFARPTGRNPQEAVRRGPHEVYAAGHHF